MLKIKICSKKFFMGVLTVVQRKSCYTKHTFIIRIYENKIGATENENIF